MDNQIMLFVGSKPCVNVSLDRKCMCVTWTRCRSKVFLATHRMSAFHRIQEVGQGDRAAAASTLHGLEGLLGRREVSVVVLGVCARSMRNEIERELHGMDKQVRRDAVRLLGPCQPVTAWVSLSLDKEARRTSVGPWAVHVGDPQAGVRVQTPLRRWVSGCWGRQQEGMGGMWASWDVCKQVQVGLGPGYWKATSVGAPWRRNQGYRRGASRSSGCMPALPRHKRVETCQVLISCVSLLNRWPSPEPSTTCWTASTTA